MDNKGNVLKVVELGMEKKVYEAMKKPGFSAEALSRELSQADVSITAQSIRKFIKKTKKAQQELIQKDLQTADVLKTQIMDYSKSLKTILNEVEMLKNEAKDKRDLIGFNQLVGRIFQGIELLAKLSGDIRPKGSIDINIIYNEINNDIEKQMRDMKSEIFKGKIIDIDAEIVDEDNIQEDKINKVSKK